jgi:hypothetical protein
MKWGYVIYHFPHCYINYCILCNEKAEKKLKKNWAELRQHYSTVPSPLSEITTTTVQYMMLNTTVHEAQKQQLKQPQTPILFWPFNILATVADKSIAQHLDDM